MNQNPEGRVKRGLAKLRDSVARLPVHVSLFVLIPFIISGFALLAFIIAYQGRGAVNAPFLVWGGGAVILFAALSGIIITRAILVPVKRFIETVRNSPAFPREKAMGSSEALRRGDFAHFDLVIQEVTNLISKVDARERFPEIIGQSDAVRAVLSQVVKVAPTDATVLILGESGVGKELIADAIYRESRRREKPFIKLNCVAIPSGLLESELFGHEKGAFTGAQGRKIGKFELAQGGSIFLDEIGDMPLETQAKLLRVLQERQFERVGGNRTIEVDVRFIAASNKNLQRMVADGEFREDLFYRLDVFTIYTPPLRDRIEDIPLIARHLLEESPGTPELSAEAMRELMTWHWPGNVRELKNILERAVVMAEGGSVTSLGLTRKSMPPIPPENHFSGMMEGGAFSLDQHLADQEKEIIVNALTKTGGIQSQAAPLLGISQRSLWHRIKKYNIDIRVIKDRAN